MVRPRSSATPEVLRVREEIASSVTHGIGIAASIGGGIVLITLASLEGSVRQIIGAIVFSVTLVLLYSASTLYHSSRNALLRSRLQVLDHCAIFLLIAGTYTPFVLGPLRGAWGWSLFGIVWFLAAAGVVFKIFLTGRYRRLSTGIYLGMGWLALVAAKPLLESINGMALLLVVVGGLFYTIGTLFYHNHRLPYAHAVWHLFVLGGSTCHFFAVLSQAAPGG